MLFQKNHLHIFCTALCSFIALSSLNAQNTTDSIFTKPTSVSIIERKTGIEVGKNESLASLYDEAEEWLKTPYRRGGMSEKGMDCSGLASTIYKNVFDIKLQRSSNDISRKDVNDLSKEELKPGDLVFFGTSRKVQRVNHVGVYLGNDLFVHASTSQGVIISSLDENYYKRTWIKGGRPKTETSIFENLLAKERELKPAKIAGKTLLINKTGTTHTIKDIKSTIQHLDKL